MAVKKKMKTSAKILISALVLLICAALVWVIIKPSSNSKSEAPHAVELEGDIEITIPEDQDSEGF